MRWSLLQLLLIAASAVTAVSGIEQNDVIHYYDLLDEVEDGEAANKIYHEKNRGLVPQLWPNYTAPTPPPAEEVSCNMAYLQCSYRAGCGLALQKYTLACADLAHGRTRKCSTHCRHTLIALMSTKEGQRLMKVRFLSFPPRLHGSKFDWSHFHGLSILFASAYPLQWDTDNLIRDHCTRRTAHHAGNAREGDTQLLKVSD